MQLDLKKKIRRRDFIRPDPHDGVFVIDGVGKFHLRSVGNTGYTTAMEVYFRREHRKHIVKLNYHLEITDDGEPIWLPGSLNWQLRYGREKQPIESDYFVPRISKVIHDLLGQTATRQPTSYLFFVLGTCEAEIRRYDYDVDDMRRTIAHMTELLGDEEWLRLGEPDRSKRLTHWVRLLDRTTHGLHRYMAEREERTNMLRRIQRIASRYAHHKTPEYAVPLNTLIAQAVEETSLRPPPPMIQMYD